MNKAHGNGVNQWRNQECVCNYFRREEGLGGNQEGMGSRGQGARAAFVGRGAAQHNPFNNCSNGSH